MLDTGWTNVGQVFVIILLVTRLLLTKLLQTKKQPHIQIILAVGYHFMFFILDTPSIFAEFLEAVCFLCNCRKNG